MRGEGRGRRETEMDGVKSPAAQGPSYGERETIHRCTEEIWERRHKNDNREVEEEGKRGIMSKGGERKKVCVWVRSGQTEAERERRGKRRKLIRQCEEERKRGAKTERTR